MTLSSTDSLLAAARTARRAVAAFNVITLEHAEGIVAGAEQAGQPVILQISENAVKFHSGIGGRTYISIEPAPTSTEPQPAPAAEAAE